LPAHIDLDDAVVAHGLGCRIKYARLVRRNASSPRAKGADRTGQRYAVNDALTFAPTCETGDFRAPFLTASGWGTYTQQTGAFCSLTRIFSSSAV